MQRLSIIGVPSTIALAVMAGLRRLDAGVPGWLELTPGPFRAQPAMPRGHQN